MPHILVRLLVLVERMMNAPRVVFAMRMYLVLMTISRLQMSKPHQVNSLSTVALVNKMQPRHVGSLVETMMIVVLVRLAIQV